MKIIERDINEKIDFLERQAVIFKDKIKKTPTNFVERVRKGEDNLIYREKLKYFMQRIRYGEDLLKRRQQLNGEINNFNKHKEEEKTELVSMKNKIQKMVEEKKELDLQINKSGTKKKKK